MTGDVFAITSGVPGFNGLAVNLGEKNVNYRLENGFGRTFEQIGNAHANLAVAQANGVVDVGEGIKLKAKFGNGCAGAQFAVGLLE